MSSWSRFRLVISPWISTSVFILHKSLCACDNVGPVLLNLATAEEFLDIIIVFVETRGWINKIKQVFVVKANHS